MAERLACNGQVPGAGCQGGLKQTAGKVSVPEAEVRGRATGAFAGLSLQVDLDRFPPYLDSKTVNPPPVLL